VSTWCAITPKGLGTGQFTIGQRHPPSRLRRLLALPPRSLRLLHPPRCEL